MLLVGVGHLDGEDEEALSNMRSARLSRAEDSCFNLVAKASKVSLDLLVSDLEEGRDVFEEADSGLDFSDPVEEIGPKVARIRLAKSLP